MTQKITLVTPFFGASGYANHGRSLANALVDAGADVIVDTQKHQGWETEVSDREFSMLSRQESVKDRTMIMIAQPQFWRLGIGENPAKFIGFLVWEGNVIPKYWLQYIIDPRVSQVWVPSVHTRDAVLNALSEAAEIAGGLVKDWDKIRIVPHGVDLSVYNTSLREEKERPFTFLAVKGWAKGRHDRGGLQYAIKAFKEEFLSEWKQGKVQFLAKINPAYLAPDHNAHISAMMNDIGVTAEPQVMITTQDLKPEELRKLYYDADVFINTTRAEGFGLTGLEAHACGLATIQSCYGGQTDYMEIDTDTFIEEGTMDLVDFDLEYEGVKWFTPSIPAIRQAMRWAYEHPVEMKAAGIKASTDSVMWTWRKAAEKALANLKE